MADAELRLRARDETAAAFRSVESSFQRLEQVTHGFQNTVAGVSAKISSMGSLLLGGILTGSLSKTVEAAVEADRANVRLAATLKATGNAAGFTKARIDEMSESLAATTFFDDDAIRDAAAEIAKFGSITGTAFERALKAATDWAAFSGQGVREAAQQIGVAVSGTDAGLGRLERQLGGLTYAEETFIKSLQDSGDLLGAQEAKLRIVEQRVGGLGQEMTKGLSGAVALVNRDFKELLEGFGKLQTQSGLFERSLRGLAALLRDITLESQGTRTALSALADDAVDAAAKMLKILPGLGLFVEAQRLAQTNARIAAAGRQSTGGKITGIGDAEAEEAGQLRRTQAFWDAQLKVGDKITERQEREERARIEKLATERERFLKHIADEQAKRDAQTSGLDLGSLEDINAATKEQFDLTRKLREEEERRAELLQNVDREGLLRGIDEEQAKADALIYTWDKFGNRIAVTREEFEAMQKEAGDFSDVARDLGLTFSSAFEDAIVEGRNFQEVLRGIGQDLLRIAARKLVTEPLAKVASDVFGSAVLPAIRGLFGAQFGADFTVGGSGGTDSQLVAFMASPGERVMVTPPGQGTGGSVNVTVNVDARGGSGGNPAVSGRTIADLVAAAVRSELIDQQRVGGLLA